MLHNTRRTLGNQRPLQEPHRTKMSVSGTGPTSLTWRGKQCGKSLYIAPKSAVLCQCMRSYSRGAGSNFDSYSFVV